MIEHKPNLDIVTRAARCEICPHCPLHWGRIARARSMPASASWSAICSSNCR